MLLTVMGCYLFFYTGRHNIGFAIPALKDEFDLTAENVGWMSGTLLLCYGMGQFINGRRTLPEAESTGQALSHGHRFARPDFAPAA